MSRPWPAERKKSKSVDGRSQEREKSKSIDFKRITIDISTNHSPPHDVVCSVVRPSADDRETPTIAFRHLLPILDAIERSVYKNLSDSRSSIRIYDPYFCAGTMKSRLVELGLSYRNIYNENVDCYEEQKTSMVSPFDVLLTNPPFSGDHIKRCLSYAISSKKPFAMLIPSNVFLRPWYETLSKNQNIIYVAPHERYGFTGPSCETDHVPLVCMWFVGGLNAQELLLVGQLWRADPPAGASLCLSVEQLPRRIKKLLPYTTKRANKKKSNEKTEKGNEKTERKTKNKRVMGS